MGFFSDKPTPGLAYVRGNLIDALERGEVDYACHGANCFRLMGAGIAREVKQRCRSAWRADQETASGALEKLGSYSCCEWPQHSNRFMVNGYTQFHVRQRLNGEPYNADGELVLCDYDAIRSVLRKLHQNFASCRVLGLPLLGCGLARGEWALVHDIILQELVAQGRSVRVYVLNDHDVPAEFRPLLSSERQDERDGSETTRRTD